jgi:hypothetical protein
VILEALAAAARTLCPGAAAALVDWEGPEIARLRAFGIVHGALLRDLVSVSSAANGQAGRPTSPGPGAVTSPCRIGTSASTARWATRPRNVVSGAGRDRIADSLTPSIRTRRCRSPDRRPPHQPHHRLGDP